MEARRGLYIHLDMEERAFFAEAAASYDREQLISIHCKMLARIKRFLFKPSSLKHLSVAHLTVKALFATN